MEAMQVATRIFSTRTTLKKDTTEHWNQHPDFIPLEGEAIVYTDYAKTRDADGNTINVANIKIGDGKAYVVDLPFIYAGDPAGIAEHVNDFTIHVTQAEKDYWNEKLNCELDGETLILK